MDHHSFSFTYPRGICHTELFHGSSPIVVVVVYDKQGNSHFLIFYSRIPVRLGCDVFECQAETKEFSPFLIGDEIHAS